MATLGLLRGDDSLGEVLQTVLEDDGHTVVAVGLDLTRVAMLATLNLDAIVMEGYPPEAVLANVRQLRAMRETAETPIVVLTTTALDMLLKRDGLEREVHEVPMPFDLTELLDTVGRIAGKG